MTASDTVTANPFAKPLIPALGKTMRPVASMATPATTATNWKRVEVIFSSSYVTRRLIIPRITMVSKRPLWVKNGGLIVR